MSEPNAGSDVISMKTNAKKSGNKYLIDNIEIYIEWK